MLSSNLDCIVKLAPYWLPIIKYVEFISFNDLKANSMISL